MQKPLKKGLLLVLILFFGGVLLHTQAQQTTGELKLEITAGQSCCVYGTSVVFGEKDISFGITEFTGDFLSYHGTTSWGCKDLLGTETGRAMYIAMSGDMENQNGNKIGSGNVKISFDETTLVGGNCEYTVNSGADISLSGSVELIEKAEIAGNYGKICELGTTNVQLKVVTNTGQAPGNYVGTLIITLPPFANASCNELIGTFYDAETDGLNYEGDQGSIGITSNGGKFSYKPGEQITFKVGTVTLGNPVIPAANGSVFVTDLFALTRTEITNPIVIEVGKLLQGLDEDNDPTNGITITGSVASSFTENGNVTGLNVDTKLISLGKSIRTIGQVVQHLEDTAVNKLNENIYLNYSWAKKNGGSSADSFNLVKIDDLGNNYVVGNFGGTVIFGSTTLIANGAPSVFIGKSDSNGNWLRAKKGGGTSFNYGYGISIDTLGNSYVAGVFNGTGIFDGITLLNSGIYEGFVGKLDTNGNWLRAKKGGGTNSDYIRSIGIDTGGNSYVAGYFQGTATFGNTTLLGSGNYDIVIGKLDTDGNWLRAKRGGGTGFDYLYGIAVDTGGNSYVVGNFQGTATFGNTTLLSSGDYDMVIGKLDTNGNWLRAKKGGGTLREELYGISVDNQGNSYVAGNFQGTATFGNTTLTSNGSSDGFIGKLDTNGNWLRAKKGGGTLLDQFYGVTADLQGNSYIAGYFQGSAIFGTKALVSNGGSYDGIVGKLDTNGNWLGVKSGGGTTMDLIQGITTDTGGNIYAVGGFQGTVLFDPNVLVSSGNFDMLFRKIIPRYIY